MLDILIISGKQGSGKTTTQKIIQEQAQSHYDQIYTFNFADPLYQLHDIVRETLFRKFGIRPEGNKDGLLLQVLGTEWGRAKYGSDFWVGLMKTRVLEIQDKWEKALLIIGDCRFENEFNAFPEALRVRLDCPQSVRETRAESWRANTQHPSEVGLDDYSFMGFFDLYFDTYIHDADHVSTMIIAQLKKQSWLEKRGQS